ncbi:MULTISPECIES: helix-turn-helix domain-containing protein [unclassified Sinorhizobium]|uniref:helix-turn-helix domain-containing protein n=1 Tax=unclassified Sinorhizobium TaxID=2613772 RepID=UPI003524D48A
MTLSGRVLRRMRLLAGIKQSHLAERLNVSQATVSRWERGLLTLSADQALAVQAFFAVAPDPARDAALKRLVESSSAKVHLICDRTHRLLAASPARQAEWRAPLSAFLGRSLLPYASAEIAAAEGTLEGIGWHEGYVNTLAVDTGMNSDPLLPIATGRVLWERISLADGSAGRLVTTIA